MVTAASAGVAAAVIALDQLGDAAAQLWEAELLDDDSARRIAVKAVRTDGLAFDTRAFHREVKCVPVDSAAALRPRVWSAAECRQEYRIVPVAQSE